MRRRVVAGTVLVAAVAVALFGVPLGVAASRLYRSQEAGRLEREATRAAGALPPTGLHGTDAIELPAPRHGVRLGLYDSGGHLVVGTGPARGGREVAAALAARLTDVHDGRWLAAAVPLHDEEAVVGAARAAIPWDVVHHRAVGAWLAMLGLGGLAVLVAAGLAWRQARHLVAPVDQLGAAAVRIGDGDFAVQVAEPGLAELDRAAGALNRTAARLGDLVTRERAFTADASHQLATPLTSLRLGLESALVTSGTDPRDAIRDAVGEVERLERTVATLLALARDAPIASASCDVAGVAAEAADRYRDRLAAAGRPLRVDVDAHLAPARCSGDALREVLGVLIDNALEHGRGEVGVRARRAGTGVVVEVEDEGDGVANPAVVFTRRHARAAGHGIGLALARSLAEAHGARLELTRSGPRPVFTVALPGGPA
jgi:signal transduction histidine kinase